MIINYGTPVTLVSRTRGGVDAYGNDIFTEDETTTSGAFNPGGSSEQVQGGDIVVTQPTVYLPPGTDVTSVDAVLVNGQRYEVDGSPNVWASPFTGWQPGVEVKLKAVTG